MKSEDTEAGAYGQTINRKQPRIKTVLRCFLKTVKLQASWMSAGRLLQVIGAEIWKVVDHIKFWCEWHRAMVSMMISVYWSRWWSQCTGLDDDLSVLVSMMISVYWSRWWSQCTRWNTFTQKTMKILLTLATDHDKIFVIHSITDLYMPRDVLPTVS